MQNSPKSRTLITFVLKLASISNGVFSVDVPGDQWYRPATNPKLPA